MKKYSLIIYCIVAISLFFSSATTSLAYTDITDASLKSAIEILSKYNIMSGYDDGTFRPESNITRAEFSKVISYVMLKQDTEPDIITKFEDVPDSHWAKKYIYLVKSFNIVGGTSETVFDPNGNVTYEQAIKMIVVALGYEDDAIQAGGYPSGYISIAKSLGILDNVTFNGKNFITRGDLAYLLRNALDCPFYFLYIQNGEVEKTKAENPLIFFHEQEFQMKNMREMNDKVNYEEKANEVG